MEGEDWDYTTVAITKVVRARIRRTFGDRSLAPAKTTKRYIDMVRTRRNSGGK
jgi:hypothetical protein